MVPEDTGVILQDEHQGLLVVTRLRHKSRQGEEALLEKALAPYFPKVERIKSPGFIEGGDVLITDDYLYIGLSKRTNLNGALQLKKIALDYFGMKTRIFPIPKDWLHLKGGVSFHHGWSGQKSVILTEEQISDFFNPLRYDVITISTDEHYRCYGPNCTSKGKNSLIHKGAREACKQLEKRGFSVLECDLTEIYKVDGAMTCLSKIFKSSVVV